MVSMSIKFANEARVRNILPLISKALTAHLPNLWTDIGPPLRDDVRDRLDSQDHHRWAKASKWIRAKKGTDKLLQGLSHRVGFKAFPKKLEIFFNSPGQWTLDQHADGFKVPPTSQRVTIKLRDPSALGLPPKAKAFSFMSKNQSVVPARKTWPTEPEVVAIIAPRLGRWVKRSLNTVPGVRVI